MVTRRPEIRPVTFDVEVVLRSSFRPFGDSSPIISSFDLGHENVYIYKFHSLVFCRPLFVPCSPPETLPECLCSLLQIFLPRFLAEHFLGFDSSPHRNLQPTHSLCFLREILPSSLIRLFSIVRLLFRFLVCIIH